MEGRGVGLPHRAAGSESSVPVVGMEYLFITKEGVRRRDELDAVLGEEGERDSNIAAARVAGKLIQCFLVLQKSEGEDLFCAKLAVEEEFGIPIDEVTEKQFGEIMGPIAGRNHWESIVQFMAGTRPGRCPAEKRDEPGTEKCVALIYQGVDAVRKIREVLGPTDPSKAPSGTIRSSAATIAGNPRREFGQTVMINAAHASDSPENAKREMDIIQITENNLQPLITSHLS